MDHSDETYNYIYKRAIEKMERNREKLLEGGYNCIRHSFSRLSQFWPGVEKGKYYLVTASSGVGKSKWTKKTFVFDTVDFVMANPGANIDLKIFYFCLEESKVNFIQSLMSYQLYDKETIRKSVPQLNSVGSVAEEEHIEKVKEWKEYWETFENYVEVIDDIRHPTGIFKHVEKWLLENGHWEMENYQYKNEDGTFTVKQRRSHYVSDHPDRYVEVIIDHFGLLSQERQDDKLLSLHATMSKMSSTYFIQLRDGYDCSVINVQQQAAETEKQQFTYKGQSIDSKVEPSLAGLGDNKLTQRDADMAFGIFAPERYEIEDHKGYNIVKLQDHYRSVIILKYRDGIANVRVGMFFDGATGHFEELPPAEEMKQEDYEIYMGRVGLEPPTPVFKLES